jgi:hypothetical protein
MKATEGKSMNIPAIVLILTIITPPDRPNMQRTMPEASIEKCWEDAQAFIAGGMSKVEGADGAHGIVAACAVRIDERS